jgi:rod shape-determining protein MreC
MVLDHRSGYIEPLRSSLSVLSYPIYLLADAPSSASTWLGEVTADQQSILGQKHQLEKEKILLQAKLQKFEALEAENLRLRNLLDSSFKVGERVLIAELSSVELDPYRQQVVISKGTRSGVFISQPVLDARAVMGQVINTSPLHSTVLLITDASHALPVQVLRNGLRTVAVGTGEVNRLSLPFLAHNADIQTGDMLVTSGLGGIFPPGYPVARISDISLQPGQHFSSISAEPLARLDRSREVLLVWTIKQSAEITETNTTETDNPEAEENPQPANLSRESRDE